MNSLATSELPTQLLQTTIKYRTTQRRQGGAPAGCAGGLDPARAPRHGDGRLKTACQAKIMQEGHQHRDATTIGCVPS